MEYRVIRSRRRTMAVEIRQGEVLVRAPLRASGAQIRSFVDGHAAWISEKLTLSRQQMSEAADTGYLTGEELRDLAERAAAEIPPRVDYYARKLGVSYGSITIRRQRTRWGSCSSRGNLSFNCLLMLAPEQVLDSVIVHELCHRLEMNHSERFYREVYSIFPEYDRWHGWLKEHGAVLMARVP